MSTPYDFLEQNITSSCLIQVKDNDSFFEPTNLQHTGYAFDGLLYTEGVPSTTQASWFSENLSLFRGPLQTFPTEGIVLISTAAMGIFDVSGLPVNPWMVFLLGDSLAFVDNFTGHDIGFKPKSVQYANGIISTIMTPDPGSNTPRIMIIHMDFVRDRAYLDTSL